jgi:hypothetical protein
MNKTPDEHICSIHEEEMVWQVYDPPFYGYWFCLSCLKNEESILRVLLEENP